MRACIQRSDSSGGEETSVVPSEAPIETAVNCERLFTSVSSDLVLTCDMLPKFSNPYSRVQSLQIVSRHDLVPDGVEDHLEPLQDDEALAVLETLVKRSLGEFYSQNAAEEHAGTSERKRKRRKVETSSGAQAEEFDSTVRALLPRP